MARPLRIEFDGAFYHVTSRGNTRDIIYFEANDYLLFLDILGEVCKRFNWLIHCYCLMPNHYHILVETPEGNLSLGMRHLNGVYTQRINRRYGRCGHLFQGRFKGILVDTEVYYKTLVRYVMQNPLRACMVQSVGDYSWSSYNFITGKSKAPDWLVVDQLLAHFSERKNQALKLFKRFVNEYDEQDLWDNLSHQIILGDEDFAKQYLPNDDNPKLSEIPKVQKRHLPKPLAFYQNTYHDRSKAIFLAFQSGGYTMTKIATHFNVHYSTVSKIVSGAKT